MTFPAGYFSHPERISEAALHIENCPDGCQLCMRMLEHLSGCETCDTFGRGSELYRMDDGRLLCDNCMELEEKAVANHG